LFAHRLVDFIGPAGVEWTEVPDPDVSDGVIVEVVAAGVSFADLLQTQGRYQLMLPLPFTPGMDAAGVVRSAPPGADVEPGQRVAVLRSHGCWQEVLAADPRQVLPLPEDMSFEMGAAAPLNYLIGLFALDRRGRAQTGEILLVHGGAGGVGVAAIQLGRALGLRTIAVTSDGGKRDFALRCGAHHAVLSDGWLDAVRDLVGERAVDIVFDPVGGDRMTDSLRSLAPEGRLLVVGFTAGEIPTVKVNRLLLGNIGVLGVGSREFFERNPSLVRDLWGRLLGLRESGALPDLPVEVYPFREARLALRTLANREAKGKSVLSALLPEW
jgi:NADPH2:quinone reductase